MFVSLSVFTLHGHPNNEKSIVYNEKLISQKEFYCLFTTYLD